MNCLICIILHFIHIVPQFLMSGYLDRVSPLYSATSNVCMHLFQYIPARTVLLKKIMCIYFVLSHMETRDIEVESSVRRLLQ